jgi:hypothetical protein
MNGQWRDGKAIACALNVCTEILDSFICQRRRKEALGHWRIVMVWSETRSAVSCVSFLGLDSSSDTKGLSTIDYTITVPNRTTL